MGSGSRDVLVSCRCRSAGCTCEQGCRDRLGGAVVLVELGAVNVDTERGTMAIR